MTKAAGKAGMDWAIPYMLRHTAASLLIDQGVSIEAVADLLGDDPRTLYRHYRHRVRRVVDATAPMEALFGADATVGAVEGAAHGQPSEDGPPHGPPSPRRARKPAPRRPGNRL